MQPHHINLWWAHIHMVLDFPREETGKGNKEQDWIQPRGKHITTTPHHGGRRMRYGGRQRGSRKQGHSRGDGCIIHYIS